VWKKPQKILKKNHTSLNRNQIRPHFNEPCTIRVWHPCIPLSRPISRIQVTITKIIKNIPIKNIPEFKLFLNIKSTTNIFVNTSNLIIIGSQLLSKM
jgi:hypothetical protein